MKGREGKASDFLEQRRELMEALARFLKSENYEQVTLLTAATCWRELT